MKKRKLAFVSATFIFLTIMLFFTFTGNPYERLESKRIALEYVGTKYPNIPFTVDSVGYYPFEGTYVVHVISENGSIQTNIDVRNGKIKNDELQ